MDDGHCADPRSNQTMKGQPDGLPRQEGLAEQIMNNQFPSGTHADEEQLHLTR
jgi:hypothetical protein